uniref:Uncharacterized protein n=1 Tax=Ailuropoda melanoleuca TaxID=9646 RepID=A0A7N5P6F0_AILME
MTPGPRAPARPAPPGPGHSPAAYLKEPSRRVPSSGGGSGRRSHSARPQPRGRGPGQSPHRRTRAPRLGAHAPKPGQLALFRAQGERQESLPVSRSSSSYSRHLRWRPQRPRRRDSRAAPANEPSTRCSSSRPAAPPALCFCASPPGSGLQTWFGHLSL